MLRIQIEAGYEIAKDSLVNNGNCKRLREAVKKVFLVALPLRPLVARPLPPHPLSGRATKTRTFLRLP